MATDSVAQSCARYRRCGRVRRNYCRTTSLEERCRAALKKGHAGSDLEKSRRHSAVRWKVPWKMQLACELGCRVGFDGHQAEKSAARKRALMGII